MRNKITTPAAITSTIFDFAKEISPNHEPRYVAVRTEPYSIISECHRNLLIKVDKDGGKPMKGWMIWEHPGAYLSAEFHSVWENGDELTCISRHPDGETQILFVPHPEMEFQFTNRVHNRYKALTTDPLVRRFIQATIVSSEMHPVGPFQPTLNFIQAAQKTAKLYQRVIAKY